MTGLIIAGGQIHVTMHYSAIFLSSLYPVNLHVRVLYLGQTYFLWSK